MDKEEEIYNHLKLIKDNESYLKYETLLLLVRKYKPSIYCLIDTRELNFWYYNGPDRDDDRIDFSYYVRIRGIEMTGEGRLIDLDDDPLLNLLKGEKNDKTN